MFGGSSRAGGTTDGDNLVTIKSNVAQDMNIVIKNIVKRTKINC
jgi:hypothetical protein